MRLPRCRVSTRALTVLAAFSGPVIAHAQCPDGTPPPCRGAVNAMRRTAPALNDHVWIVVPFANVTRTPELEWLRDASVNLLSLDMGRWTDVAVVNDKRVADLIRSLPTSRASQPLSLGDGITLARQAGAGRLVMGDFIKVGRGTRLVANVFDVRNAVRLRSVQQPVSEPDSLLAAFGPLARGVLSVPPPPDARVGATGTTQADAYREYSLGVTALHRFELTEARRHFLAALAADSSFALAHYKLSIVLHWEGQLSTTAEHWRPSEAERLHAATAARLGGSLPPRERALISSRVSSATGDHERACATLATLVKRDSSDVDALYALGDCRYHSGYLQPEPTADTTRGRFRGDWNGAITVFRRVLLIDPTYHPAFEHVLDMLTASQITVCVTEVPGCGNGPQTYAAWVIRDNDTLLIQPVRGNFTVKRSWRVRQDSTRSPLLNLREAQRIAREWTDAGPAEARAHLNLAKLDMRLGELAASESELALIPATADAFTRVDALETRVKLSIVRGKGDAGRAALDSLARELPNDSTKALRIGALAAAFGRVHPALTALDAYGASHQWTAERRAYMRNRAYASLGMPLASMLDDERRYAESLPGDTVCAAGRPGCRLTDVVFTLAYAPRASRAWWPYNTRPPAGGRFFASYAIFTRDTAYLRKMAALLDSIGAASHAAANDDLAFPLHSSEIYLALGDSVNALKATRWFTDSTMTVLPRITTSDEDEEWKYLFAPRMMKQRGDLAARLGYPVEARVWYERVLSLWATADPEFKAETDRMRAAVAAMGGRR